MPNSQRSLIDAVEAGRAQYAAGANDMAKGASRPARRNALCNALGRTLSANGWVGRIYTLSSNTEGKGVLAIELAPDVYVKTWNNAFSDIGDRTLIDPGSQVFGSASSMRRGQLVRFSGTFLRSETDCIKEVSNTLSGSMREPEFLFRFSGIDAWASP